MTSEPQRGEAADALQPARELDVLHEGDLRVAAEALERRAADEDRLVSGADPRQARAEVHQPGDQPERRPGSVEADVEAAVDDRGVGEGALDGLDRAGRQARVGVEEEEDLAGRPGRARVHLARPAAVARTRDGRPGSGRRSPGFRPGFRRPRRPPRHRGSRGELRQQGPEVVGLVEDGDDDREPHGPAGSAVRGEELPGGRAPPRRASGARARRGRSGRPRRRGSTATRPDCRRRRARRPPA